MNQSNAKCLFSFAVVLTSLMVSGSSLAAYPDKPITLVVPYPPGGATDTVARKIQESMSKALGQPVLIENKAGAGTAIGAAAVAKSAPDGYTLLISSNTTFTVNPALKSKLPFDPAKDFEGIGVIGTSPLVLIANPKVPANNLSELIAMAQKDPGKLSFGSFGNGTTAHIAGEMLNVMAGVNIVHVPYKGSAPAMTDLIGGQIPLTFDTNVASMPMIASGKVKAIAVTSLQRYPQLPNTPTISESGYPGFEMVPWIVVVAPNGLPPEIQRKLSVALEDTLKNKDIHAELVKTGVEVQFEPGSAYATRVAKELPLLKEYVKKANIPVE